MEELSSSAQRRNAICRPSGDQSPERALFTTRWGSPPREGTRKRARFAPVARVKRIMLPSREKRGDSSEPTVVSGVSAEEAMSLTQMQFVPLRSETKQTRFPSAETEGE